MQIRIAIEDDIPAIQSLYRELDGHHVDLLPVYFQKVDGDIRTDESIAQWIVSDDKAYFIATVDGAIVGFASVAERTHPAQPMYRKHRYALIDNAVVATDYRGRGIGQALFDAAAEWARRKGIATAQVQVWNANRGAYRFYLRQGFSPITTRMELPLSQSAQTPSADGENATAET